MKNISAGGKVIQTSDVKATEQEMKNVEGGNEVLQNIGTKPSENSINLAGFGKAKGKIAVIVFGGAFILFLLWRYFTAH